MPDSLSGDRVPNTVPFLFSGAGRSYGETVALAASDLQIARGERVALVGPSGSGKTTLLKMLNGSVGASSGQVCLFRQDVRGLSPRALRLHRCRIATIPQHLGLVPNLRVFQNIVTGRLGRRGLWGGLRDLLFPARDQMARVHALLERVGIEEKLYERTSTLSGGQQQRVAVARALFQNPEAILADEPVSGVDPARAASLIALLSDLALERELTLVMSLHNLELARAHFPRLIGLRDGAIRFDGPPDAIEDRTFADLYHLNEEKMLDDG
ncbi:MAG: ATP-binding cassette domain-containing protein [Verrucomicrobiota bacterium]